MTRDELIEAMSADAGITKAAAEKALKSFCDHTGAALLNGEKMKVYGFGTFTASKVGGNGTLRNPRTGVVVDRQRTAVRVGFRSSPVLKRRLAPLAEKLADRKAA